MNNIIEGINALIISTKNSGYKTGAISDTYHTFDELYDHRTILFLALLKQSGNKAWYSLKHSDGTMFEGMFIAGIETEEGQATYHIEDRYLSLFKKYVREIPKAPEWDGHTPDDVLLRLIGSDNYKEMEAIIEARNQI